MKKNFYPPELLQTPEGVRDIYGEEGSLKNYIQDKIHHSIKSYGFNDIQTPSYEPKSGMKLSSAVVPSCMKPLTIPRFRA